VFDWIVDDCRNDYELSIEFLMNVETMMKLLLSKMIYLKWIYYYVVMNIKLNMRYWLGNYEFGLWRMVVWVLQMIYCCIFIECNCDEYITKDLSFYYIEWNYHEWLYEYYKRFTIVLYWMLIITNGCMSITNDLLLYFYLM